MYGNSEISVFVSHLPVQMYENATETCLRTGRINGLTGEKIELSEKRIQRFTRKGGKKTENQLHCLQIQFMEALNLVQIGK